MFTFYSSAEKLSNVLPTWLEFVATCKHQFRHLLSFNVIFMKTIYPTNIRNPIDMDLNKAMTEMYKQRRSLNSARRREPKKTSPNKKNNKLEESMRESEIELNDPIETKQIEEPIIPKTSFDQLYGCDDARDQILSRVKIFQMAVGGHDDKSDLPILICGSRGLGKTSLVEAAANYSNLNMIKIPLVSLVEQTKNEFKESLEHLIRFSKSNQPAIVLIDNLEQIVERDDCRLLIRGTIRRLLDPELNLLIFCTTSSTLDSVSYLDFLLKIHLKRPNSDARYKILESLRQKSQNLSQFTDEDLKYLATNTPSFTALDLKNMLDIARGEAIRKRLYDLESTFKLSLENCDEAIEIVKQSFEEGTHLIGQKPSVTWNDIGGLAVVRQAFVEILKQTKQGGRNCKYAGIALYGPPGCGKTMVAQAMANEGGFNFISIKPAELVNKFLGETEKNIRRVFHEAREYEPCMIYFDEFDGLCGTRGTKDNLTSAIQTLLSEMDGFVNRGQSIILASTNRLEDIDPAMKRPGRLSKHIYVGPPDEKARKNILEVVTSKPWMCLANDVDLEHWARKTENFTGAELDFLVAEAEQRATSDIDYMDDGNGEQKPLCRTLTQEHFIYAFEKIRNTNRELGKKTRFTKRAKFVADGDSINCNCNCHLNNNA